MVKEMILKVRDLLRGIDVREEEGQTLIEYGLIIALISIAVIVVLGLFGPQLNAIFQSVVDALSGTTGVT